MSIEKGLYRQWKESYKKKPVLLHHGLCSEHFKPGFFGSDYFGFFCKCKERADIYAVLIDERGRIIFNIRCNKCQVADAIKTITMLFTPAKKDFDLSRIHLSPSLKNRVSKHSWDGA
ncbi:hypothetical protein ACFL96_19330 [Thermoproteota archaeon]